MSHLFTTLPLGARVPDNPHAVVAQLPAMSDVIGYEERRPETMSAVRTGYPRFRQHPLVTRAARTVFLNAGLPTRALHPVASVADAERVAALAGLSDYGVIAAGGWALLHLLPNDPDESARAAKLIQHTGVALSSRQAEDWLAERDGTGTAGIAATGGGDFETAAAVRAALAPLLAPVPPADILPCRSGMNAFFAAFEAVRAVQRPRGRSRWLQLGWLYTDTPEVLRKCLNPAAGEGFERVADVLDKNAVEKFFADNAGSVAGVVAETPTNPLLRTPDLAWLRALANRHGALLVLDPSSSGLANVNVLPFADILVCSLTKYAAHEGDVMAGVLAVNPATGDAPALLAAARNTVSPAYWRDLARLAEELKTMPAAVARMNANAAALATWLHRQPAVRRVHWTLAPDVAPNYAAIARSPESCGCLLTIELNTPPARFYDRARCVKGPSFGTGFTIVSPYLYMAHYDLVRDAAGRRELLRCGLDPELIRISVGTENFTDIAAMLAEALG
ncbi:MAG: PLP-dependent transferase [Puniceicoccales bacterium]|jgi:cystathionine gamma-synthase|nr:PLP-dependent transferase [Puniceicoccales bacterium]